MCDDYRALAAFDDVAFAALKVSLSEPERTVIIERLRQDWMADVGVIGVLRLQHINTSSVESPAKLYWESRRESLSPRIESLFAAFLIDLAAAIVYDVLKELAAANYNIARLLEKRGVNLAVIKGFVRDIRIFIKHARIFMRLYHAREDAMRADEVREVIKAVLSGQKCEIENPDADAAFEVLMANLIPAIRGLIKEELKQQEVYVADEADAVLSRGLAASSGFGFGAPRRWKGQNTPHEEPYVLLIDNRDALGEPDPRSAIEQSAAVVSWEGGMTSHIAVICRGIHRAAVIVSAPEAEMLGRKKFLVVDGNSGLVRSYNHPPVIGVYPPETRKQSKRKRRRNK